MKSKNELILTFLKWHFAASQIRSEYENENANLSFRYSIFSASGCTCSENLYRFFAKTEKRIYSSERETMPTDFNCFNDFI